MTNTSTIDGEARAAVADRAFAWRNLPARALRDDATLATEWDRLNAARIDVPFLSADAICLALENFGDGGERLLIGSVDSRPRVMLVLVAQGRLQWSTFQPSQVPLGAWVADAETTLDEIVSGLLAGPLRLCLVLSITQIDPRMASREVDSARTRHDDYIDTAWIDVHGTFEQYWEERGKNLRQNMKKQHNKLAAEGTRTSMRVWREPDEMSAAIARYGALESAGWKAGQGTAIRSDNAQGRFYRGLLESAARRDEAVIHEYLFDERPVAIDLSLVRKNVLFILKTTYDETLKPLSPSSLLQEERLRSIFGSGAIERIEFYGRLMDWHAKLTRQQRTLYHLTHYRWPWLKTLAASRRGEPRASGSVAAGDVPDDRVPG